MQEVKLAQENLIYKARTGSNAYGTVTKTSDDDYAGVFIPTKDYVVGTKHVDQVILGTKASNDRKNTKDDIDYTVYALPKFIKLAKDNNPNIIELFFIPERCVLFRSDSWDELQRNYALFISKKAYHTFKGYAYSQRLKLQVKKENLTGRTELVEQFGYDVKFGSHLVRLLLEGLEILTEGKLTLPLNQNNLVLDIKLGKYSLQDVLNTAIELEKLMDKAYIESKLQNHCDEVGINSLQIKLLEDYWNTYGNTWGV